ncbi:MAG: DinB family protein [Candidatus Eisenbacteria bacterium]|nr:DinB family protein [Candidatus Eisenbacteria bacterium]
MKQMPWIERRFDFGKPPSLFPGLIERLRGTPARVEDRVRRFPPAVLRAREGTTWSVQENVGHLIEVESLWFRRLDDYAAGREMLRAADMENRSTKQASYNDREIGEILSGFRDIRRRLVERLEALDDAAIERSSHHPRLNRPMRVIDMVEFVAEHDDHHLVRISELIRAFGAAE